MLLTEQSGNACNVLVCGLCAKCVGGQCYKAMSIDVITGEEVKTVMHSFYYSLHSFCITAKELCSLVLVLMYSNLKAK